MNGRLVVTTPPEGSVFSKLTTDEFDGDFVLKLISRATPNADSGVFVRGRQLQCRDFLLAGPYGAEKFPGRRMESNHHHGEGFDRPLHM